MRNNIGVQFPENSDEHQVNELDTNNWSVDSNFTSGGPKIILLVEPIGFDPPLSDLSSG
jgi:hypothetical protein